jgi:hypothetical protein
MAAKPIVLAIGPVIGEPVWKALEEHATLKVPDPSTEPKLGQTRG